MAASATAICKRAAQILGAGQENITDIASPTSFEETEFSVAYAAVRDAELRKHRWNFAKSYSTLTAAEVTTAWPYTHKYPLPSGCLAVIRLKDVTQFDIAAGFIYCDVEATDLHLEYIAQITDTTKFDALFDEALAAALAYELCETFTQSNTKKAEAQQKYEDAVRWARRTNAIESGPKLRAVPASWIEVRR